MKRNGVSPEYIYDSVVGTFNMQESKAFFGSKMITADDVIELGSEYVTYYQRVSGEQIDINQERSNSVSYSLIEDKNNNHLMALDPSQSSDNIKPKASWVLEIDANKILTNYIFSLIKKSRAFSNILNADTIDKNISTSIIKYINLNVLPLYKMSEINLFIEYVNLEDSGKKLEVNYKSSIDKNEFIFDDFRTIKINSDKFIRLIFDQGKFSDDYTFNYYFNIKYNRI